MRPAGTDNGMPRKSRDRTTDSSLHESADIDFDTGIILMLKHDDVNPAL